MTIPQHLSIITIGATDMQRLRRFYRQWGWSEVEESSDAWCAFDLGGCLLSIYPVDLLGAEAAPGDAVAESGWNGISFAINFPDEDSLRNAFAVALSAGARLVAELTARAWGGISGYIADPEGNRWELATGGPNPAVL